ncbi:MAG: hypothetical protein ABI461_10005, partial [Polyangiaceae bacterium]
MRSACGGQVVILLAVGAVALAGAPNAFAQAVGPAPAIAPGATSGANTGAVPGSVPRSVQTTATQPTPATKGGKPTGAPAPQPFPAVSQQAAGADPGVVAGPTTANGEATAPTPLDSELLRVSPNGVTADQVGKRAAETSWQAKANEEALRGAAARVDAAWAS